jgi:4-aminobutyrate aminotransferase
MDVLTPQYLDVRALESEYLVPGGRGHDHLIWDHAQGSHVWDVNGRELIDFSSGVLVTSIGHSHPRVTRAITEQAGRLLNCYDAPHPLRAKLAQRLVSLAGASFESAALFSTGSEAIEAAVKVARAFTGRYEVMSFSGAFHGKTIGSLSLSGLPSSRQGIGPLNPGSLVSPYPYCYRCPIGMTYPSCNVKCADLMQLLADTNGTNNIAAIIVEPYLGTGGAVIPPREFWEKVREFADSRDALLIFDEVQSGFGRTGSWFAFQQLGIVPDIIVTAKGIANGVPTSAVISRREILSALSPGSLGSTYGGNPMSCAAALATLDVMEEEDAPLQAYKKGQRMMHEIKSWDIDNVGDIRGMGLSLGLEVVSGNKVPDAARALQVVEEADNQGLVVLPPAGAYANVVRLAPSLLISDEDLGEGLRRLHVTLKTVNNDISRG